MKRKSLVALIASLAVFGVVLTGCNSNTNVPVEEAVQEEEAIQEAGEAVAIEAEETAIVEESSARYTYDEVVLMTRAYGDFFSSETHGSKIEGIKYACIDINNDGIPEVIYQHPTLNCYMLAYLEKSNDDTYCANNIRVGGDDVLVSYNPETGVFFAGNTYDNGYNDENDTYSYIDVSSYIYKYNNLNMEVIQLEGNFSKDADYTGVELYVDIPCNLMNSLDIDLTQFFKAEDFDEDIKNYEYYKNDTMLHLELFAENDIEHYEAIKNVYEQIKQLQDSWLGFDSLSFIHSYMLEDSMLDWCASGEVTLEDLTEYTNTTYFADYFDYE